MEASDNVVRLIARREGGVLISYEDGPAWEDGPERGLPRMSKGFGFQDRSVKAGDTITLKEAFVMLKEGVRLRAKHVSKLLKVPVTQAQFDALVSLYFQSGNRYLPKLVHLINEGNAAAAARIFPDCDRNLAGKRIPGLRKRRLIEQKLFLTGDYGELSPIPLWRGDPKTTKPEQYHVQPEDFD